MSKFLVSTAHLSSRSSKFSNLSRRKDPSNHCKASILFASHLQFFYVIISYPEFFMQAQHGGSSRILLILQLFFKFSLEAKIRQDIL